jgi:hypothetical protein
MESNRTGNQLTRQPLKRQQAGITLIGFLLLAAVFGTVGFAILLVVPLYMESMSLDRVLGDLQEELATGGNPARNIELALDSRFYVENLEPLNSNELEIVREGEGYTVNINRESRALFMADLYFVVMIDKQVEIAR